jgi:hypothetical protein
VILRHADPTVKSGQIDPPGGERTHGWDAEAIPRHHPDLSLGRIHSALAYDHDHKPEMDRDIADRHERATKLRAAAGESPGRRKLREQGRLP